MAYGTVNAEQMTTQSGYTLGAGNSSAFKNRIYNGQMQIDQRNSGASVTPTNGQYLVDRWFAEVDAASKFTVQQNAGSVTPPLGFTNYLGCTSTSAYTVTASQVFIVEQRIEGFNIADFAWGTANAKTVTLSFQVYSSLTGTFGGGLQNGAANRSYPFSYTISSANTWTTISITIAGDTSGTWITNSGRGINLSFGLGCGSTYSGTAGAWTAGNYYSATGATSVVGTSGATFYLTGVQLEVGSTATSFDYRPYGTELALCQRYFQRFDGANNSVEVFAYAGGGGQVIIANLTNCVTMRANPTATFVGTWTTSNTTGQPIIGGASVNNHCLYCVASSSGGASFYNTASSYHTLTSEL
jgi:hypothetical protein